MLSKNIAERLNAQLNLEISSAYKYMAMSAYCSSISMAGAAHWLKLQVKEELEHAEKVYRYILDQGMVGQFEAVDKPTASFASLQQVFEGALKNELDLQVVLNNLATSALSENDNTTYTFIQWFLTEQVEEVSTVQGILDQIKIIGNDRQGLYLVDRQLAGR